MAWISSREWRGSALAVAVAMIAACSDGGGRGTTSTGDLAEDAAASAQKAALSVPGGQVVVGFASTRRRASVELDSFRISRHPVTRAEYEKCVKDQQCAALDPDAGCFPEAFDRIDGYKLDAADVPALCVSPDNAEAYCKRLGGQLPTVAQWMRAARGTTPARYTWGDAPATCEQHPRAIKAPESGSILNQGPPRPCHPIDGTYALRVAQHAGAASAMGMQDVLLAPGELVSGDESKLWTFCSQNSAACVIYSGAAGSIDAIRDVGGTQKARSQYAYSFRCAFGGVEE